ncbi:MAG TPA: aldo/keto reductase [Candidatus Limnocylindrales bacterium]|jgi:aryl-alcohol dehydrogenase-like predicted oxidoreductase/3-hydroxyisobutyrate dehydrogenase-like beta-hydroxyacid dehydrogenase
MQYTKLGERGPRVSRIAFGNWSAGGDWGRVDRAAAIAATREALDIGITLFDTAHAYGFGAAEEVLGEALKPEIRWNRESIVIATKGGLRKDGGVTVRDSSPAGLRHDLEASLRALGTDYVDIYQVHWPHPATPIATTAETLDEFVRQGRVRYVGVSNYDPRQMTAFQHVRPIDTLQPPYHLFRREIEKTILPFAQEHGIGVLVYGPLAHGLLSGRMTEETTFAADDWRSKSDLFEGEAFRRNLAVVRDLTQFAALRGATVAELAIAWTLANPAVDVAIAGARSPEQIRQTAPGADLRLSPEDIAQIELILRGEVAVGGPAPKRCRGGRSMNDSSPLERPGTGVEHGDVRSTARGRSPAVFRVAILGTGKMGSAIASRLSTAAFEVVLWNRTRSRAEALGIGTVAEPPADAAWDADIIISSLTGPEAVLAAYLGPDGALTVGAGKRFVEMSTAGTDLVSNLGARVTAAGGTLVDAPIIGAPTLIRDGEGVILVGGADEDVAAAGRVLTALGTVRHVGPLGSAARLKLVANSMLADVVLAAAELQMAGEDAGLDPENVFWVLKRFVPALEARRSGYLEGHYAPPMFALRDLRKDLDFAISQFDKSNSPTPLTRLSRDLVSAAAEATPDLDISAVVRPYRKSARSTPRRGPTAVPSAAAAR